MPHRLARLTLVALVASSSIIAVASPAQAAARTFQVKCLFESSSPHRALDDPIVNPGSTAAHMHDFFGNVSTNRSSTYESMIAAGTRCGFSGDTAAYWIPTLINPSGASVNPTFVNAYYRSQISGATVTAFPPDFRLVTGFPDPNPNLQRVWWSCTGSTQRLAAPGPCGTALVRATVVMPSCGQMGESGVVSDSASHRSHVAYPTSTVCPASHPVLLPKLTLEFRWKVRDGTGYRIASGAPDTMHADFWNTWQQGALERLVSDCLNAGIGCGKQIS